jgi:ATP synthase F1 complex assembly factor 2
MLLHKSLISIDESVKLSRLEEQFSIDTFGLVEGSHDVDENITRVNISAAKLF